MRRVVVTHTSGDYPGLRQIIAVWGEENGAVLAFVPGVPLYNRRRCYGIELAEVSDTMIRYTEVAHPTERLHENLESLPAETPTDPHLGSTS